MGDSFRPHARSIRGIAERADDLVPVWDSMQATLKRDFHSNFTTRGATLGSPWKPLSPYTVLEKKEKKLPKQPVRRTLKTMFDLTRSFNFRLFTRDSMEVGSKEDVARFQHFGTVSRGSVHVPARKLVGWTIQSVDSLVDKINKHITRRR